MKLPALFLTWVLSSLLLGALTRGWAAGSGLPWALLWGMIVLGYGAPWVLLLAPGRAGASTPPLLGLAGAGVVGVAAALRLAWAPTWPWALLLALSLSPWVTLRGGWVAASIMGAGVLVVEVLPMVQHPWADAPTLVGGALAAGACPLVVHGLTRAWHHQVRESVQDDVGQRLLGLDEDARTFRLVASTNRNDLSLDEREQRRKSGSVQQVRESLEALVHLMHRTLQPHSTILFLLNETGTRLKVHDMQGASDHVVAGELPADKGVLGTVIKKKERLLLTTMPPNYSGVTYYMPALAPRALLAVPVLEGEHVRGVLLSDWLTDHPLSEADAVLAAGFAREMVRCIQNERLFATLDRERTLTERLFALSREFMQAKTLEDAFATAVRTSRQLGEARVAVVLQPQADGLHLAAADGMQADRVGQVVRDEGGLVARLLSTHGNQTRPGAAQDPAWLSRAMREPSLGNLEAVRMYPLSDKEEGLGILVVGFERVVPVHLDVHLDWFSEVASLAVANAALYARLERMATTDGLTGLINHRTFQERLSDSLRKAVRYKRPLAMILTDIDHFKNVNDTYGHPVGDEVIRRVSRILKTQARATDLVARYGGEEFAVVMEETDAAGALQVAERIRQAVLQEVVQTDMGPLKVTLSLGVSAYPTQGDQKHELIERADQALYTAKHGGRNRAVMATAVTVQTRPGEATEKA